MDSNLITAVASVVTLVIGSGLSYGLGRKRNVAEIAKLKADKNVSDSQAAAVVATAAAEIVGPLLERLRELQDEVNSLRQINKQLNTRVCELEELMKEFLPKGVPYVD